MREWDVGETVTRLKVVETKARSQQTRRIVFRVKLSQQRSAMDYSLSLTNKRGPHNYVEVLSRRSIWKKGIRRV